MINNNNYYTYNNIFIFNNNFNNSLDDYIENIKKYKILIFSNCIVFKISNEKIYFKFQSL